MKRDMQTVMVPFPKGLMSTARAPSVMPATYGREILNMLAVADGAGKKRNGVVSDGGEIAGAVIVALATFVKVGVGTQLLAVTAAGKIYLQNGSGWDEVWTGLNTAGVPRIIPFGGRLVLCNGYDNLLVWDGTAWREIAEFVTDLATGLTYVSATQFSIESDAVLYPVGSKVRARLGVGTYVEATVSAVGTVGSVVTVTLASSMLTGALDQVAYTAKPPKLAYLYAAHDRLWGFGKGPLSAGALSADVDRTRVFYSFGMNNPDTWHDADGVVPSFNLADKSPQQDELVAMAVKDGMTVFFLKNAVQVWTGSEPGVGGDFSWGKTIPVGAIHAELVAELPNDVLFFTRDGVRTLGRVLQTEQLDVSDVGGELDPTVNALVAELVADDAKYRAVRQGRYGAQGWYAFTLAGKTLVFQVTNFGYGWSTFDGAFAEATAYSAGPDGKLYIGKGAQVYRYDEGVWADDGEAIVMRWWTPWLRNGKDGRRWANRYVELLTTQGVALPVALRRMRNMDEANAQTYDMTAQVAAHFWDVADWDSSEWDNGSPRPSLIRDHHVSDEASYAVESSSTLGPLTVFGLKLYGIAER